MRASMVVIAGCLLASCDAPLAPDAEAPDAAVAVGRPALLAATISAEIEVDAPIAVRAAHPGPDDAVFDGDGWVTVVSPGVLHKLGPDGELAFPFAVDLGGGRGEFLARALASDGETTAVAYPTDGTTHQLFWRRYDRSLAPLTAPLVLAADPDVGAYFVPDLAYGGGQYLVVWSDGKLPSTVWARRVSAAGALLDPAPIRVSGAGDHHYPSVAWDGQNFLVGWVEEGRSAGDRVRVARVSTGGEVLDEALLVAERAIGTVRLAYGGGAYVVAWTAEAGFDVVARRLSPAMTWLDPAPVVIGGGAENQGESDVVWSGDRFLFAWVEGAGGGNRSFAVDGRDLPVTGAPGPVFRLSPAGQRPEMVYLATGAAGTFAVWDGGATRVAPWGTVLDPGGPGLRRHVNWQGSPALAAGGGGYLAAWRDDRPGAAGVYVRRLDDAGRPQGTAVRLPGGSGDPAVAFDGHHFLVAWSRPAAGTVEAVRVAADGSAADPAALTAPAPGVTARVRVAPGPAGFLVTWDAVADSSNVHGWRIPTAGAPGAAFPVSAAPEHQASSSVVRDGAHYRVLWRDDRDDGGLRSARVSDEGAVLDPAGVSGGPIAAEVAVVAGPDGAVIAWSDPATRTLRAARLVDGAPEPAAGSPIATAAAPTAPALTSDGATVVVAWRDGGMLRTTRLWPDATPLGGAVDVATLDSTSTSPTVAALATGDHLVALSRLDADPYYRAQRVRLRRVTLVGAGAACAGGAECASGHCADGVCCDTACGGSDPTDCQACSRAAGAAADGACGFLAPGTVCRAAAGDCDVADTCTGAAAACPADGRADDDQPCSDGDACTDGDVCRGGACAAGAAVTCAPAGACEASACDPATGACATAPVPDGTRCDDADPCTVDDGCRDGACAPGLPVACAPPVACQRGGVCDPADGSCRYQPADDGEPCPGGSCRDGACVAAADAGVDAGTAAPVDAAPATDAGSPLPDDDDGGCGCASTGGAPAALAPILLAVLAARRRRRR